MHRGGSTGQYLFLESLNVNLEISTIGRSQKLRRHRIESVDRHLFGSDVIGWREGILMTFQHRQDGAAQARVTRNVYGDGSVGFAERTMTAIPKRIGRCIAFEQRKWSRLRFERNDTPVVARSAEVSGVLARVCAHIDNDIHPMRSQLLHELALPATLGIGKRHLENGVTSERATTAE